MARTSATEKKFGYAKLLESMGATHFGDDDGDTELSAVIVLCCVLPALVKHLPCTLCGTCLLTIRVVDCGLGMVSMLETFCTACEEVIGKTH